MQRDPRAFLWDVREAAQAIQSFTAGLDVTGYVGNELVQAAVERKFEVIGEALNQLAKLDPAMAARIPDVPQIVAFRNQLIHGYATVNPDTVWNIAQNALPGLLSAVQALLDELRETQPGKVLYEMEGVNEELAREAFALAAAKLPFRTTIVTRTVM